jgi:hypothetical protein
MKPILAIDPGVNGGIAWTGADGIIQATKMPDGMTETIDFLRTLSIGNSSRCILERTGTYQPGNSGPSAATFARHCGHLEAALYCLGVPTVQVTPQRWQKHFGALPKEKPERKRSIKELMSRRYPHLTVTLKTADALGILTYAIETSGGAKTP